MIRVAGAATTRDLMLLRQATMAIASPPRQRSSSSPQSRSSTFGTDEPLRLNIGDGPGGDPSAAWQHAAAAACFSVH
jgi:hypothetical protein